MKKTILILLIMIPILTFGKTIGNENLAEDDLRELIQRLVSAQGKIPSNSGLFQSNDNRAVKQEIESIISSLKKYDSSNLRTISKFESDLNAASKQIEQLDVRSQQLMIESERLIEERQKLEDEAKIKERQIKALKSELIATGITDKVVDPSRLERKEPLITLKIPKEGAKKIITKINEMFAELSFQKSLDVSRDNITVYKFSKEENSRKRKEILFWIEKDFEYPSEKIKLFFEVGLFQKLDGEFKRIYVEKYRKELPQNVVNSILQKFNQP